MSREIKFRALRDDMSDCSFVYGSLIYSERCEPRIHTGFNWEDGLSLFTTCLKGTEGQYTGLKDKNGKEIYEGDIVEADGLLPSAVIFYESAFRTEEAAEPLAYDDERYGGFTIIGNIHEHPHLLSGGN